MPKAPTKASARGRRKSLVEQYKAKARGKKTSQASQKPVKRKKNKPVKPARIPVLQMDSDGKTYNAGDLAYYIIEHAQFSKRVHMGEIKECHPNDNTAPCVTVFDHTMGQYRVIRASLIGWNKAEAKKAWQKFVNSNPKASKKND